MNPSISVEQIDTPAVVSCVRAYLLARAFAETRREQVDAVKRELLESATYRTAELFRERGLPERVTDPKKDWLMDQDEFACYLADCNQIERERGIKPDNMPDNHCPALVAEHLLVDAENLLIEESGKPFGVTNGGLLCARKGLESRQKWIDLVVGLIITSHPEIERQLRRAIREAAEQLDSGNIEGAKDTLFDAL